MQLFKKEKGFLYRLIGKDRIVNKTFIDIFWTMVIAELAVAISKVLDGLMISFYLGADAIAAHSMTAPYFGMVGIFGGMLATGTQMEISQSIGKGELNKTKEHLSAALLSVLIMVSIFLPVGFYFRGWIAKLLGATGDGAYLAVPVERYFVGLLPGTLAHIWNAILIPVLQINGDKKRVKVSLVAGSICNCFGNLLSATVFDGGIMGMGLSTSIAEYISLMINLQHFWKKEHVCQFSLKTLSLPGLARIVRIGLPKATKRLCNTLRPLLINRWIIFVGTGAAMSALAVQNSLRDLLLMPGAAVASTLLLMTNIYYGEEDKSSISNLLRASAAFNMSANVLICFVLFLVAPWVVRLYIPHDAHIASMAVTSLRWFSLSIPFAAFNEYYLNFLQGTARTKLVHMFTVCEKLLYIVGCSYLLGILFGTTGVFASFFLSEFLLSLTIYIRAWIVGKKLPTRLLDITDLPKGFGYDAANCMEISVQSMEDVACASSDIMDFCRKKGFDPKRSYYAALCAEEMLRNTVEHGFADGRPHGLSLRCICKGDDLILRIRDDCRLFDIIKKQKEMKENKSFSNLGIRIVGGICKELIYVNSLNTNNIVIRI